jgi:hypothetical protein
MVKKAAGGVVDLADHLRFDGRSSGLWVPIITESFAESLALATDHGMSLAPVKVAGSAGYRRFLSELSALWRARNATYYGHDLAAAGTGADASAGKNASSVDKPSPAAWVVVDACSGSGTGADEPQQQQQQQQQQQTMASAAAAADLSFRTSAALAYGAQGLLFSGLHRCDGGSSPSSSLSSTLDALALATQQAVGSSSRSGWTTLLLDSSPAGVHVGTIFATDPSKVPGAVAPARGSLIEQLGPDLIAAVLEWNTHVAPRPCFAPPCPNNANAKPPQVLLLDSSCATSPHGCWLPAPTGSSSTNGSTLPTRVGTVQFHPSVLAWGVDEADTSKGFPSCSKSRLGGNASVRLLPGGAEMLLLTVEVQF